MASWISRSTIVALACSIIGASAAAVAPLERRSAKYQLSVYYGQNSANQWNSQQPLTSYCGDTSINMMPIGFVTAFNGPGGVPVTNFANACTGPNFYVNGAATNLLNCQANIGRDMQTCKSQHGTKFLISLGGATYNEGGWATPQQAQAAAKMIFAIFGPKNYNTAVTYRPFGDICIDGFDLDFEMNTRNLDAFSVQLRQLIDTYAKGQIMLTAAPQCPFPDANVGRALDATLFDAVFIQFYNNYCSASTYNIHVPATQQGTFNLQSWQNWANGKRTKLYIGFVADPNTWGYTSPDNAAAIIKSAMQFPNFGGAMVWDISLAMFKNPGFLNQIKSSLGVTAAVPAKQVAKPAPKPAPPKPAPKPAPKVAPKPSMAKPSTSNPVTAPAPKSQPASTQQKSTSASVQSAVQNNNNTQHNSTNGVVLRRRHNHHHRRRGFKYLAPISA